MLWWTPGGTWTYPSKTPGHTPEHLCFVVAGSTSRSLHGGPLIVGDVGRPDLFPGQAEERALKLYDSLHGKLMVLSDHCEVYPTHGLCSLCGRFIGSKWTSTIGYERFFNQVPAVRDREHFIDSLTRNMPPAPDHFSRSSEINRQGPALKGSLAKLEELSPEDFRERIDRPGAVVMDVRSYEAFGGRHLRGAWNLDFASPGTSRPSRAGSCPGRSLSLGWATAWRKSGKRWCGRDGWDWTRSMGTWEAEPLQGAQTDRLRRHPT